MIALKNSIRLTVKKGGENVFVSNDLRVDFVINLMVGDALNTSRISVYNLSPACVKTLSLRDAPITVKLEVGRSNDPRLTTLFQGDLINIHHTPMFENTITTLWCWQRGGKEAQATPKPAKTFTGLTVRAIATNIVQAITDSEGKAVSSISFDKVTTPVLDTVVPTFVFKDSPQDALRDLLKRYHLQYSLVNGIYQVADILTREGQIDEVVITIDSGVFEVIPNFLKKPVAFSIASAEVVYNLTPSLAPLDFMAINKNPRLQSNLGYSEGLLKLASGVTTLTPRDYYQILKIEHRGSCYTDQWETEIQGIIYSNSIRSPTNGKSNQ